MGYIESREYKYVYTVETMEHEKVLGQFDTHMLKPAISENEWRY